MHPIRRLIELLEAQLFEFEVDAGDPPPPVDLSDEGDRLPEGGQYWFKHTKIKCKPASIDSDFAIVPFTEYKKFGFDEAHIRDYLRATTNSDYLLKTFADFQSNQHSFSGGIRTASIFYALSNGWGFIEFDEDHATIWLLNTLAEKVIENAAELFPLTQMDQVKIISVKNSKVFENGQMQLIFKREDFPGFSGPFGAVINWSRNGVFPEQNWVYTVASDTMFQADGIHAEFKKFVNNGNWTHRDVYTIPFYNQTSIMHRLERGKVYRFPYSVAEQLHLEAASDDNFTRLFSKYPFVIPREKLQTQIGSTWKSV